MVPTALRYRLNSNGRGEPVDLNFAADNLEDLRNGLPTRVVSDFDAKPAKFSFDGQSNLAANLFAQGKIAFEAASLKEFLEWFEPGATVGESIDALSLTANLNAKDGKILLLGHGAKGCRFSGNWRV